jgi:CheY-like chemotaxis protein
MPKICLIAEADPFITRLLRRFASESGMHSVQARSGQELVELARRLLPEVILLEPELPGKLRGWEAYRCLKEDPRTARIPVVACSWLTRAELTALVGELKSSIHKPEVHYEDFTAALRLAGVEVEPRSHQPGD